jgi:Tfp pilus assembly protein PilF
MPPRTIAFLIYQTPGRFLEAAEAYRRTIAIRADDADAITNLGTTLLALGETDEVAVDISEPPRFGRTSRRLISNIGKDLQ